jgi:rhodanese-related sulfurtransferase
MSVMQVTVQELCLQLERGAPISILDVREPFEVELASLPGSLTIPMGEIGDRLGEIPTHRPVFVLCHHGIRSFQVAHWLRASGFPDVTNVRGGIDAWSLEVDSEVPRYA